MARDNDDRKLKFAVFGVGRMGARHAQNVAYLTPRAQLVAIVDPNKEALEAARSWAPKGVKYYEKVEEALKDPDVEAVLIASVTASHAPDAIAAIEAGKHVLVEKPLSIDLDTSRKVVEVAEAHPELKVMVGFSRRFDESYREVKKLAEEGALGNVHMIRSATNDQYDPTGFFVAYSKFSGGIWIDCGIHDIDIARWIFDASNPAGLENPKKQVNRVYAIGQNVRHPELVKDGDADNALAVVEFASGKILHFHCSRTTIHGHDCVAEVFGTEGRAVVNSNPSLTRTELRDAHGVRTLSTPTYYERFKQAFVTEVNEFTAAVLDDKPLPVFAKDALEASKIAAALTESFRRNKPILFDEEGEAILD